MKLFLGVVMALALLTAQGRKPNRGNCVDEYCVTLHTHVVDFNSARKSCEDKEGHLMTVRSTAANSVISDLLTGQTGNFWIGLRYMKEICSKSSHDLKGYTWITGDEVTNFTNWKDAGAEACSPSCVSLSKEDPKWTERPCDRTAEGYLCEYKNTKKCKGITSETPVLYETPFGFAREDLQEVPNTSNATDQHLGTKYICHDAVWHRAPWNCEVYKGGCEHDCHRIKDTNVCTCPPGYQLESSNAVRCSKLHSVDPCMQANCSQKCVGKGKSYVCQCHDGYKLGQDGKTCKENDHCNDYRLCPDENSYCFNTPGGFECRCKTGFTKVNGICEDDDECFSGPCEHLCNNTIGSYHCECSDGYKVSLEDRHKCKPYCMQSECLAVECDLNKPFQCNCPDGFILEERPSQSYVCVDIDECASPFCDHICTNAPGDFSCSCNEGFHLIGKTKCVKTEGLSTTSSIIPTPTSSPPSIHTLNSAGAVLGIVVFVVMLILLIACIIHHNMKRCGKIITDKNHRNDVHALQQVTIEKYVKKQSISQM